MWKRIRALVNLNAFFRGCERYYEMLVAIGLARPIPAGERQPTAASEADSSCDTVTDVYTMKEMYKMSHLIASIPVPNRLHYWN